MSLLMNKNREEKILVLLDFELYSPNTILRGAQLAEALKCEFEVIFLIDSVTKISNQPELELMFTEGKKLSRHLGAKEFRIKKFDSYQTAFKYLENITKKLKITQLVLAHLAESRWEEIFQGSYTNYLLKKMPFLEIHLISQDYAFPYDDWTYDKGIYAFLEPKKKSNEYYLTAEKTKNTIEEGVFFKESNTDFDNGVFISLLEDKQFNYYKVHMGLATLVDTTWFEME